MSQEETTATEGALQHVGPDEYVDPLAQLEGESDAAYQIFTLYADQEPHERSMLSIYRSLDPDKADAKAVPSAWRRWAKKHHWQERVAEHDRSVREDRDLYSLYVLESHYQTEDERGAFLCGLGLAFLEEVERECKKPTTTDPDDHSFKMLSALGLFESKAYKAALDTIKLGSDLQQRAQERKAQILTALSTRHDAASQLSADQELLVKTLWEALVSRAKGGDITAIEAVFNRIGLIPESSQKEG